MSKFLRPMAIVALLVSGCLYKPVLKPEPEPIPVLEFAYRDRVEIIGGFWRGSTGTVVDQGHYESLGQMYYVILDLPDGRIVCAAANESELVRLCE